MIANYLYKNLLWTFNKKPFAGLLAPSVTEKDFFEMLERLARKSFPLERRIDLTETEFCLNSVSLGKPQNEAQRRAQDFFWEFWAQFVRLKTLFGKKYLRFPSDGTSTRIEQIAELLCKCTQFAVEENVLCDLLDKTRCILSLTERENRYLDDVVRLYKTRYYCAATAALTSGNRNAEKHLARFLHPMLLKSEFCANRTYRQAAYAASQIATVVNCMGSSAARLGNKPANADVRLFVYANGRNVFDTFVQSRFGQRQAEFLSEAKTVRVKMRYFAFDSREVRNCTITNKGKRARKFSVEVPLENNRDDKTEYFKMGNALCVASNAFVALAVVRNSATIACYGDKARIFDVVLGSGESCSFDVVTLYADSSALLAEQLADLERFGATRCPFLWDGACTRLGGNGATLTLSPHGYGTLQPKRVMSETPHFSYRLGDDNVATFLDGKGCSTTLLNGFAFGVRGESVYSVQNGLARKLNSDEFALEGDKLVYAKKQGKLTIFHNGSKVWHANYAKPSRTLFYFPLERPSRVEFDRKNNRFVVSDCVRSYTLHCSAAVESYTDSALECSEEKLRYKLSDTLNAGNCLAICCAPATEHTLTLTSKAETPPPAPLVKESLVSTYLNYVNDKSVFCLNNKLKRPDCLTLAAICYTNPQFVRNYLTRALDKGAEDFYYDAKGQIHSFCDKLAVPLATVYYLNLVGDLPAEVVKSANGVLFFESFQGKELCVRALALLKAARLEAFDRVKCLVEYSRLKKVICADSTLFAYAQAIGAVPLSNPSKERLKDLCNKYDIPKSWYYVSQLENLYGLSLSAGKLQIAPTAKTNVLEQFALNIAGKRIDTTFTKASVQCMTLNGQQCFAPFYAPSLKKEVNELVVSY